MTTEDLIDELLKEVERDRLSVERREQTLRALRDSLRPEASNAAQHQSDETAAIVAAKAAYPFYIQHDAYVCQPNRAFNHPNLSHLGFYANGRIEPEIPRIVAHRQDIPWTRENAKNMRSGGDPTLARIGDLIESTLKNRERYETDSHDVFLLTPHNHTDELLLLPHPIIHQTWKHNGAAWTRKHRYVSLDALRTFPETTDELAAAQHEIELRWRVL